MANILSNLRHVHSHLNLVSIRSFLVCFQSKISLTCVVGASPLCNHLELFDSFIKPSWTAWLCLEVEEKDADNKEADRRSSLSVCHLSGARSVSLCGNFSLPDTGGFRQNHTCNMYEDAAMEWFQCGAQRMKRRPRPRCLGDSSLRSYMFSPLCALIWLTYSSCC